MKITTRELGPQAVVVGFDAPTALDASNGDALRQSLNEISDACSRVIVDLSDVTFVDSSALGAFVGLLRRLRQKDGELKLAALRPPVLMILELTRLDNVFSIYLTVDDAEAAFTAGG